MCLDVPCRVVVRGLLFLEVARVRQQDPREVLGPSRRGDRPAEAVLDEPGQVPDVVDVGVREGDGVDPRGIDGQLVPVPQAEVLQALVEAAVHEEPPPGRLDQELRAGDRPRGAQALDGGDRRASGNDRPPSAERTARPRERTRALEEPMPGAGVAVKRADPAAAPRRAMAGP